MARAAYFFKFMLAAFLPQIDSRRRARKKKSSRAAKTVYHFSFDGRAFLCGSISSRRGGFFARRRFSFFSGLAANARNSNRSPRRLRGFR